MHALPIELRTRRLVLRAWCGEDAAVLRPVLLANREHLCRWIPEHVYSAPPLPQLVERLDEFATKFAEGRAFRYGIRDARDDRVLGSLSLFPRDSASRVQLGSADRVELGYWLNAAATGSGIVTEGARALLTAAAVLPGIDVVEIHCHVANAPSNGVPRRLGFHRARLDGDTRIWQRTLAEPGDANR